MAITPHVDKQEIFDILKTKPTMGFLEFKLNYKGKISDRYFYLLRTKYQTDNGRVMKANVKPLQLPNKRKYVHSGLYSTKVKKVKKVDRKAAERRSYHKTTTCLILWNKDTSKMKPETLQTLHEVIRAMEKSKRLGFELVETLVPPRIELREYSK